MTTTMNIKKESVDALNARVTITLTPQDYQPQVEKMLREHAKKAKIPGFRPGKVPVGMIKKMYGPSVLLDEVNKMLANRLYKYIGEEKLEILGNPLPSQAVEPKADWDNPSEMEFTYDLGLAPDFKLNVDGSLKFTQYVITPTDKDIESSLENISKRNGEMIEHDTIADSDLVKVKWVELNKAGDIKEGGVLHSSSIGLDNISEEAKATLVGKKLNETLDVNYMDYARSEVDAAAMLGVKKDQLASVNPTFRITVERIQRLMPAELNEELFKRMYPDGSVQSLDDLKERIKADYAGYFAKESDRKLKNDIVIQLLKEIKFSLPDEFLKRWLMTVSENKPVKEQVEAEYPNYAEGLRWQLMENKVIREYNIRVEEEELKGGIREQLRQQFAYYGIQQADDEMMEDMVQKFMKREDEVRRVNDQLYDAKVLALFKEKATLNQKNISSEAFYEMLAKETV